MAICVYPAVLGVAVNIGVSLRDGIFRASLVELEFTYKLNDSFQHGLRVFSFTEVVCVYPFSSLIKTLTAA